MTAGPHDIDPARFLQDQLTQASPDLMRDMLSTFINALLSAQADSVCGAEYGTRDPDRVNSRNGYRHRELDTESRTPRAGHPGRHPGCRDPETARGQHVPRVWLLERHRRAEQAPSRP